jgi:hypothetical protein
MDIEEAHGARLGGREAGRREGGSDTVDHRQVATLGDVGYGEQDRCGHVTRLDRAEP